MLRIHKAGIGSIPVIQALTNAIWPVSYRDMISQEQIAYMIELIYSTSSLTEQIKNKGHQFIIVYDAERPVGFASYSPKYNNDYTVFRLHKLYVLPDQQGKGTGKLLLNYIIADIKPLDATILELNVNRHNKAFYFYEKMGFTIAKVEDIDIGNGYFMNDYVMEKVL